nr:IS30 family transposase [Brachybacterium sp. ACRRE]
MGLALRDIAGEIDTSHATLALYVRATGGIAPARWKDPDRYITDGERFRIKELLIEGRSIRYVAKVLDRAPSTISREVRRGSAKGTPGEYAPSRARRDAFEKRRRSKELKIPSDPVLHAAVQHGLDEGYSPEQVVGRLRREHPDDPRFHVSHETIYRTIYLQARGGLKRELKALTRTGRTVRHPRRSAQRRRGRIKDMVSIWERPAEALDRGVPGHWEGDLIVGKDGASAIGTVVERRSNYVILVRLDPTKSRVEATRDGLIEKLSTLPATLKATLTWDQGKGGIVKTCGSVSSTGCWRGARLRSRRCSRGGRRRSGDRRRGGACRRT